jgi:hypothetical protein
LSIDLRNFDGRVTITVGSLLRRQVAYMAVGVTRFSIL